MRIAEKALLALLVIGLAACGRTDDTARIVVTGSSTMAPLMSELAKRYEIAHPGVRVEVQAGGSSRGIRDARAGVADFGMVSRALADEERDLHAYTVARDGVALIVHRDNPVATLARGEVMAIFTGTTGDWRELGGPAGPITVISKAEGRATLTVFLACFALRSSELRPDVIVGHNQEAIQAVARDPRAVGYVSIGAAEAEIANGVRIRLLPLDGVAPTTASVTAGRWPMTRPLELVTRGAPTAAARAFLDFALSEHAHDVVRAQFFAPASP